MTFSFLMKPKDERINNTRKGNEYGGKLIIEVASNAVNNIYCIFTFSENINERKKYTNGGAIAYIIAIDSNVPELRRVIMNIL